MRRLKTPLATVAIALGLLLSAAQPLVADERYITVASTTSTKNSGLFDHILPSFTEQTGIEVRVVAVGTGAAIRLALSLIHI